VKRKEEQMSEKMTITGLWYAAKLSKEQAHFINEMCKKIAWKVFALGIVIGLAIGYFFGSTIFPWS
jgi:hypothetical protein